MQRYGVMSLLPVLFTAGCMHNPTIPDPNTISLSRAMRDTVDALADARNEGAIKKTDLGFYPCTVTAVFNISATGTVDNKLAVGASAGPPAAVAPVSLNFAGSSESTTTGTRGNTVTLVLATSACMPLTQLKPAGGGGAPKPAGGAPAQAPAASNLAPTPGIFDAPIP